MKKRSLALLWLLCAGRLPGASGAPVVFEGKTLLTIETWGGSFSPEARARAVTERLALLSRDPRVKPELTTSEAENNTDILAGDLILMSVTDADARAAGLPRSVLARDYAARLQTALAESRREHSWRQLAINLLLALLVTAMLVLALWGSRKGFTWLLRRIESWRGTRIRGLRIQRLELFSANRITSTLLGMARAVRFAVGLILLYFYVFAVLSVFPATRQGAAALLQYLSAVVNVFARAVAASGPDLLTLIMIAVVTRYVIKLCRRVFDEIEKGTISISGFYPEWAMPTYKIGRLLILAFAAIVMFPYMPGHDSPAFKGVSIFFGVLLSLGSAGAVGNIIAGVLLTYTRAFRVGDRVKIADTVGDVIEKSLLTTRVRTIKNEDVTVPNSLVLGSHVVNYNSCRDGRLILHTSVTIGYDAPWRQVHQLLVTAALATSHISPEPTPFVLQTALNDFYVTYEINVYTENPHAMANIYAELHQHIQDKFNEAGLEICSPHFAALRDGNRAAIPGSAAAEGSAKRAFRVEGLGNGAREGSSARSRS